MLFIFRDQDIKAWVAPIVLVIAMVLGCINDIDMVLGILPPGYQQW